MIPLHHQLVGILRKAMPTRTTVVGTPPRTRQMHKLAVPVLRQRKMGIKTAILPEEVEQGLPLILTHRVE